MAKAMKAKLVNAAEYIDWGTHASIIETLLSNTNKQTASGLKYLKMLRSNPAKFKPQIDNIKEVFNTMRGVSRRGLKTIDDLQKTLESK